MGWLLAPAQAAQAFNIQPGLGHLQGWAGVSVEDGGVCVEYMEYTF